MVARPPGRLGGTGGERLDVDLAEHHEVVVSGQAELAGLGRQGHALVRLRAVTDQVPEAPPGVDAGFADVVEDGLERGQVAVDVGKQRHANRALVLAL